MDASERGAMMLVRFVAVALIGFSLAEIALAFALVMHANQAVGVLAWIGKSLPWVAGLVILVKARALAQWLADWLDN